MSSNNRVRRHIFCVFVECLSTETAAENSDWIQNHSWPCKKHEQHGEFIVPNIPHLIKETI